MQPFVEEVPIGYAETVKRFEKFPEREFGGLTSFFLPLAGPAKATGTAAKEGTSILSKIATSLKSYTKPTGKTSLSKGVQTSKQIAIKEAKMRKRDLDLIGEERTIYTPETSPFGTTVGTSTKGRVLPSETKPAVTKGFKPEEYNLGTRAEDAAITKKLEEAAKAARFYEAKGTGIQSQRVSQILKELEKDTGTLNPKTGQVFKQIKKTPKQKPKPEEDIDLAFRDFQNSLKPPKKGRGGSASGGIFSTGSITGTGIITGIGVGLLSTQKDKTKEAQAEKQAQVQAQDYFTFPNVTTVQETPQKERQKQRERYGFLFSTSGRSPNPELFTPEQAPKLTPALVPEEAGGGGFVFPPIGSLFKGGGSSDNPFYEKKSDK